MMRGFRADMRFVADAERVHHAGAEVLDHDIRRLRQAVEERLPLRRLDLHRQRPLVPVRGEEEGALARLRRPVRIEEGRPRRPAILAAHRILDLNHVRAEIAEELRARRPRQMPPQIKHPNPRKRHHPCLPAICHPAPPDSPNRGEPQRRRGAEVAEKRKRED